MKATLEFSLPEEQNEFDTVSKAGAYESALWEIKELIRGAAKYDTEMNMQEAYRQICEICSDARLP